MSNYDIKITDNNGNNAHTFDVTRWDFNYSPQIKTFPIANSTIATSRALQILIDFGRKLEGFVLYGVIRGGYQEVMEIRTKMTQSWWQHRPNRLYFSSGDYHTGAVADFKAYNDRYQGGDDNVKYVLTYVIGQEFRLFG